VKNIVNDTEKAKRANHGNLNSKKKLSKQEKQDKEKGALNANKELDEKEKAKRPTVVKTVVKPKIPYIDYNSEESKKKRADAREKQDQIDIGTRKNQSIKGIIIPVLITTAVHVLIKIWIARPIDALEVIEFIIFYGINMYFFITAVRAVLIIKSSMANKEKVRLTNSLSVAMTYYLVLLGSIFFQIACAFTRWALILFAVTVVGGSVCLLLMAIAMGKAMKYV